MDKPYIFRRSDNEELVFVDFETMMGQDSLGWIEIGGVKARRCHFLETQQERKQEEKGPYLSKGPIHPSMSLGFGEHQLGEMQEHLTREKFTDVEFVPQVVLNEQTGEKKTWYDVKCGSWKTWDRYRKSRGPNGEFADLNSRNGGMTMSAADLAAAEALVKREYGDEK